MSTYTELKGLRVKFLAANPNPGTAGDVWYDSAAYALKAFVGRAAWSAGSPLNTGRYAHGGTGTTTASLIFGGSDGSNVLNSSEEYNGSGWAAGGNLNTARDNIGHAGTQTAAVGAGGVTATAYVNNSEEYDGSTWTEGNNLNTTRSALEGGGTQTAAIHYG